MLIFYHYLVFNPNNAVEIVTLPQRLEGTKNHKENKSGSLLIPD